MDWGVVLVLAAITWLEGVRRVPADALVLRQVLGGAWTVLAPDDRGRAWRLVAWWTPLTLALVVPPGGILDAEPTGTRGAEVLATRLARVGRTTIALRALGAGVLLGIVFGLPAAVARFGAWGLAAGLAGVLVLALVTAAVAARGARLLGYGWRRALRVGASLLWPFSSPRAAEVLLEHSVAGAPPLLVARQLLGDAGFAEWVRPQAYDALAGHGLPNDAATLLLTLLGRPALAAIVHAPPASCASGEAFCARCARTYRAGARVCAECRVELEAADLGDRPSVRRGSLNSPNGS